MTDRTHKRFRHNTVDLFIPSRGDCLEFGRKSLECVVTLPAVRHRYGSREFLRLAAAVRATGSRRSAAMIESTSSLAASDAPPSAETAVNRIVRGRWALAMASPFGVRGTW